MILMNVLNGHKGTPNNHINHQNLTSKITQNYTDLSKLPFHRRYLHHYILSMECVNIVILPNCQEPRPYLMTN